MPEYLHGAYGLTNVNATPAAAESLSAIVYVGTAPVHTLPDGAKTLNKPIVVHNMADAKKYLGYSDDWASYTLCEAMYTHLAQKGVGPLVLINVLNPTTHVKSTGGTASITPENGKLTIASAEDIVLDSVVIKTTAETPVTKEKGVDYIIAYDDAKKIIVATELTAGALGSDALNVTYSIIDPSEVTDNDVIGSTDGLGTNTGLYAIKNVYQLTGYIPAFLAAPGFSSVKTIHDIMAQVSQKINGHWDAYMFVDLPLMNGSTALTFDTVSTYKAANGYTCPNETVYFPLADGTDGKKHHLSVIAAANFQELLIDQDGIPYRSASNTPAPVIETLYMGEANVGKVFDDSIINEKLNKNGIASAAYIGGKWVIWGAHSAEYNQTDKTPVNVAETSRMMLYYVSNDFQARRVEDVDQPMTLNDVQTIAAEEQARLDALVGIGALIYGAVDVNAFLSDNSDLVNGDFAFSFSVTTTPLAKSLTAYVNWTDTGFATYFGGESEG